MLSLVLQPNSPVFVQQNLALILFFFQVFIYLLTIYLFQGIIKYFQLDIVSMNSSLAQVAKK